jgi:hypothetical protein
MGRQPFLYGVAGGYGDRSFRRAVLRTAVHHEFGQFIDATASNALMRFYFITAP